MAARLLLSQHHPQAPHSQLHRAGALTAPRLQRARSAGEVQAACPPREPALPLPLPLLLLRLAAPELSQGAERHTGLAHRN